MHYRNPKIVAGTLPFLGERVLLCRRAIEPRLGFWTLPAGYMEEGETVEQAALRETLEETGAEVSLRGLHCVYSLPHVSQVYLIFLAELRQSEFNPTDESSEIHLVRHDEIPWTEIAFSSITFALQRYFSGESGGVARTFIGRHGEAP